MIPQHPDSIGKIGVRGEGGITDPGAKLSVEDAR